MVIPRTRLFWSVSINHLVIDIFNASVPVLLTFISGHLLALSNTQIGLAISAYQFTSALSQPFAGWLADRTGGRWLGSGGVAWTVGWQVIGLLLAAATREYLLLVIPLVLSALGSGAFHPVGAMHASDKTRTSDLALFFFMGQFGGGLGPALTGILLDSAATRFSIFTQPFGAPFAGRLIESGSVAPLFILALAAIPAIVFMAHTVPGTRAYRATSAARQDNTTKKRLMLAPLLMLAAVVMLRGLVNPGLVAFLPTLFQSYGWTPAQYGLIASSYWIAGAFAGLVAGQVADRFGVRLVIAVTLLATAPAVYLLGVVSSPAAFALAIAVGAFSGSSHSLIVAQTQRYMPAGTGLASGAGLGFIFGMGAVGTLVIGTLADALGGISQAFQVVAGVTVITGLLALCLPKDRPRRR
ncbi:MAG: MFS transporter [Chloroflexota bacterium]|nr:MFS transporter [Chloroflexota bacterium]